MAVVTTGLNYYYTPIYICQDVGDGVVKKKNQTKKKRLPKENRQLSSGSLIPPSNSIQLDFIDRKIIILYAQYIETIL